jgi:hypothetical protein
MGTKVIGLAMGAANLLFILMNNVNRL